MNRNPSTSPPAPDIARPDVVLLAAEWRPRALLRAQLIEEGMNVVATDTWNEMRRLLRPAMRPSLAVVDLLGLPSPHQVLDDLAVIMKPNRVIVLTAIGTVSPADIEARGFQVVRRPIPISNIADAIVRAVQLHRSSIVSNRH